MSIGSVSFWQQDQSFWTQSQTSFYAQDQNYLQNQQAISQEQSADSSLFTSIGSAQTLQTTGLAQLATQAAQTRVQNEIAADEKALSAASGTSSTPAAPTGPAPATGTGTVPLTSSTTLSSLRIPPGGVITVSDGTNTTTYTSTGTDTVADLIGAINANVAGNAYVTASINGSGKLVIAGKNNDMNESVTVGGTFAPAVGFGPGNQTFQPTAGTASSSSASTAASSSTTSSSANSSSGSSKSTTTVSSLASENISSAATLLGDYGVAGSLVNMLV
ncbi:MAG: hypothetical protein WB868_15245 [Xanthobacteraceae bacterium]